MENYRIKKEKMKNVDIEGNVKNSIYPNAETLANLNYQLLDLLCKTDATGRLAVEIFQIIRFTPKYSLDQINEVLSRYSK